jgi:hypothetical protein
VVIVAAAVFLIFKKRLKKAGKIHRLHHKTTLEKR